MQKRYKYKLNMLEPGGKICAAIGIGTVVSAALWLLKLMVPALVVGSLTILLTVVFIILLVIEAHQDKVLYEDAKKENPEIK